MKIGLWIFCIVACILINLAESKVRIKCPEGKEVKRSPKKICTCHPPEPIRAAGSLVFVLDSTRSMQTTIDSVKANIVSLSRANTLFRNFVVSYYNDPYTPNIKVTTSASVIVEFLDEVFAFGGGDCPEPSIQATIDAVEKAHDESFVILITDASPKDPEKLNQLKQLLKKKHSRMFVIVTGDLCRGDETSTLKYHNEYNELAAISFGKVTQLGNQNDMNLVMEYITKVVAGKMSFETFPSTKEELENAMKGRCKCRYDYICVPKPTLPPPKPKPVPKEPCSENEIAVKRKCKCVPPKPKPHEHGSLIFVIDSTQSMDDTINQVKQGISNMVARNKKFKNYVVVTYNDYSEEPELQNVKRQDKIKTTSAAKINDLLAATYAYGGGDCPEPSMGAMRDAVKLADKHSVLFLFTDATAKDYKLESEVTALMKEKHVEPYVVIVGNMCADADEEGADSKYHNEYHTMTKALGGKVVKFANDKAVNKVMEFIGKAVALDADFHNIGHDEDGLNKALAGGCHCKTEYDCVPKSKCPKGAFLVTVTNAQTKTTEERCLCPNEFLTKINGQCPPCIKG